MHLVSTRAALVCVPHCDFRYLIKVVVVGSLWPSPTKLPGCFGRKNVFQIFKGFLILKKTRSWETCAQSENKISKRKKKQRRDINPKNLRSVTKKTTKTNPKENKTIFYYLAKKFVWEVFLKHSCTLTLCTTDIGSTLWYEKNRLEHLLAHH